MGRKKLHGIAKSPAASLETRPPSIEEIALATARKRGRPRKTRVLNKKEEEIQKEKQTTPNKEQTPGKELKEKNKKESVGPAEAPGFEFRQDKFNCWRHQLGFSDFSKFIEHVEKEDNYKIR